MNLWSHCFSQNMNQIFQGYLPCDVPNYRAEIFTSFGSHFGRKHDFINSFWNLLTFRTDIVYRTRAIISRGLYIFYTIFKDHFFVFKEGFSENSVLMYGLYSRAACNQEPLMMAPVRYTSSINQHFFTRKRSSSDLQKLWTEPTKIGRIFRK